MDNEIDKLRNDKLDFFIEQNIKITKTSFLVENSLLAPFVNKKKLIPNYILDNNPNLDYIYLLEKMISYDIYIKYDDDLLKKILNTKTLNSLKKNDFYKDLLIVSDFYKKNNIKGLSLYVEGIKKLVDFFYTHLTSVPADYEKINGLFLNLSSLINKDEELFKEIIPTFFNIFLNRRGKERSLYKNFLDHLLVYNKNPEEIKNYNLKTITFNNNQGIINSMIRNSIKIKSKLLIEEKDILISNLNKNTNKQVKKRRF